MKLNLTLKMLPIIIIIIIIINHIYTGYVRQEMNSVINERPVKRKG